MAGRNRWPRTLVFLDTGCSRPLAHRPSRSLAHRRRDKDARLATAHLCTIKFCRGSKVEIVLSYLWWAAVNCLAFSEQDQDPSYSHEGPQPSRNLIDFLVSSLIKLTRF